MEKLDCVGCEAILRLGQGDIAAESIIYNSAHCFAHYEPWEHSIERIVIWAKKHIATIHELAPEDNEIVLDMMEAVKACSQHMIDKHGGCEVFLRQYDESDARHLHVNVCYGLFEE